MKTLVMSFLNSEGQKTALRVNNVKDDIKEEEVKSAMDLIIAKNIFMSKGGDLKSKNAAQIVERSSEDLDIK